MAVTLLVPRRPHIGSGAVITAVGEGAGQALYWELVSYDPETETEGPAYGSLKWDHTRTDASQRSANIYSAPTDPALAGKIDRVKVRYGHA
jgi:hypothetical protein